jgi:hypothetical protein
MLGNYRVAAQLVASHAVLSSTESVSFTCRRVNCGSVLELFVAHFQAQRNFLIKELITWKDYEIQIAAYNNMGIGVFSEGVKIKTREGGKLCCLLWSPVAEHYASLRLKGTILGVLNNGLCPEL